MIFKWSAIYLMLHSRSYLNVFYRSRTVHQMIWAQGFSPPATATQTRLWTGQSTRRQVAASKVRHENLAGQCLRVNPDVELNFNPSDAAGIDVWIDNVREDQCLRIRERRHVKIGHVAIGISDQVRDSSIVLTKEGKNIFKTGWYWIHLSKPEPLGCKK